VSKFGYLPIRGERLTVQEAGRLGGLKILGDRGRAHFVEIGRRGQRRMRRKYPGMAAKWGKLGGRPKKPNLDEIVGEAKK
jgi:hypothetical protein